MFLAEDERKKALRAQRVALENKKREMEWPDTWVMQPDGVGAGLPQEGLIDVTPDTPEYWDVFDQLRAPPPQAHARQCPYTGMSDTRGMHDAWVRL